VGGRTIGWGLGVGLGVIGLLIGEGLGVILGEGREIEGEGREEGRKEDPDPPRRASTLEKQSTAIKRTQMVRDINKF